MPGLRNDCNSASVCRRSIPRVEDPRLLTGAAVYGGDFNRPGQLYARVVRSHVSHGTIRSIDIAIAAKRPGVVCVITAAEIPDVRIPIRLFATSNAEQVLQPPLARDRVRYVGDPVAVVVAVDPYIAEDAADDVVVEIDVLEAVLDPVAAAAESATLLFPSIGTNVIDTVRASHGSDIDELFSGPRSWFACTSGPASRRRAAGATLPARRRRSVGIAADRVGAAKVKHFNRRILATLLSASRSRSAASRAMSAAASARAASSIPRTT